jgi:hypothetical protein
VSGPPLDSPTASVPLVAVADHVAQVLRGVARVKLSDFQTRASDVAVLSPQAHFFEEQCDHRWAYLAPELVGRKQRAAAHVMSTEKMPHAVPGEQGLSIARDSQLVKVSDQVLCGTLTPTTMVVDDASCAMGVPVSPPPSPPLEEARAVQRADRFSPSSTKLMSPDTASDTSAGPGTISRRATQRRTCSAKALTAVVKRVSVSPKSPPDLLPEQAADMWSFGCLLAFIGTGGHSPYAAAVHERTEATRDVHALDPSVQEERRSPLERLCDIDDCPEGVLAVAEQCICLTPSTRDCSVPINAVPNMRALTRCACCCIVLRVDLRCVNNEPTARPRAMKVLSMLPRTDMADRKTCTWDSGTERATHTRGTSQFDSGAPGTVTPTHDPRKHRAV